MTPRPLRSALLLWALLLVATTASAAWRGLDAMPAPRRDGTTLHFANGDAVVSVTAITPEIVRVRFKPGRAFGRDHSYAIAGAPGVDRAAVVKSERGTSTVDTAALRVEVRHAPFAVTFFDRAGNLLDQDAGDGLEFSGERVRVGKLLRDDEHVYGFGEKTGRLDKRGWKLGGYTYTMWNSDSYGYDDGTDPIYASIPFFLVLRSGTAHGIFLDNTFRTFFDVGHVRPGEMSFGAEGGELDYYFIYGPSPKQVVSRYTELTGRAPLPPRWALGFHQCRYSYYPDSRVRFIADNFRERRIPADVIWLDIHYLDGFRPFTWHPRRFPDPAGLLRDLGVQGFKVVTIVDPHPKKEAGYAPYDSGLAGDHFVRSADGTIYEAPVWPSRSPRDPGPSVFPDFSRPATRAWWGGLYADLVRLGVAGIWNDMNEPAVFQTPTGTMPLDVRHDNEGQPTDHREIHNVYGMLMSRSTHEGLLRLRPGERPFVLTRATFAGGQRYAAVWPGDNVSEWTHLQASLPMLMGLGLSGFPFVGSDIGGFAGAPSPELVTRWLQTGVFYPFMRMHTRSGSPDQEPWSYGLRHEAVNRRAIELRYELLPHIYNAMHEASETGVPALRPVFMEYPELDQVYATDDAFFFGSDLLVAPVLFEGETRRSVSLPPGRWLDFWTGAEIAGARQHVVPVTLESIPIFVRDGAFVFRQPVVQHTGQMPGQPLRVFVYAGAASAPSERVLYEDDGATLDYQRGRFMKRRFSQRSSRRGIEVQVGQPQGPFRPAARDLELLVPVRGAPRSVTVGGKALPRAASAAALDRQPRAWMVQDGFVRIKVPDTFGRLSIRVAR